MLEDVALLFTYFAAGAFPILYNYAIVRRLAKKYGVSVYSSSKSSSSSVVIKRNLSRRELDASPRDSIAPFKLKSVSTTEDGLLFNFVIDKDKLSKLLSES